MTCGVLSLRDATLPTLPVVGPLAVRPPLCLETVRGVRYTDQTNIGGWREVFIRLRTEVSETQEHTQILQ